MQPSSSAGALLGLRTSEDGARRAVVSGLIAGVVALGVSELLAGAFRAVPSPVLAVGEATIDIMPAPIRDAAITLLGPLNKPLLILGILGVSAVLAGAIGRAAARRVRVADVGFAVLASIGVLAAARNPQASAALTAVVVAVAAFAGLLVLRRLLAAGAPAAERAERQPDDPPEFDRRAFVRLAVGTTAAAVVSAGTGRALAYQRGTGTAPESVAVPSPTTTLPPAPADLTAEVDGVSALFTPNDSFYRIDTALTVPRVDVEHWTLELSGMVQRPFSLSYADLLDRPLVEYDATLVCVSNEVGGQLIGNARWLGVPLRDLLEEAGVRPTATQIVGRSVDGWTAGFPTPVAFERDALVAVAMNGEPLPARHGFPARLVVPGLYGYVSATKWLEEIELTTWEGFNAYWVPRGWAKEGPVKTQSRIDVPRNGATVPPGPTAIAGVAWAQPRGISAVEVQIDDGEWLPASLGSDLSDDTWRQWVREWDADVGRHTVRVRAIDGEGETQVGIASPPQPDGATGHHAIRVVVEG